MQHDVEQTVLYESEVHGSAYAELPDGYAGPCVVAVEGRTSALLGFPSVSEAVIAAKFAVGDLGGYCNAVVRPGHATQEHTYQHWSDWAFGT